MKLHPRKEEVPNRVCRVGLMLLVAYACSAVVPKPVNQPARVGTTIVIAYHFDIPIGPKHLIIAEAETGDCWYKKFTIVRYGEWSKGYNAPFVEIVYIAISGIILAAATYSTFRIIQGAKKQKILLKR